MVRSRTPETAVTSYTECDRCREKIVIRVPTSIHRDPIHRVQLSGEWWDLCDECQAALKKIHYEFLRGVALVSWP